MPYCPRCGVEIEDRLSHCPLCDTAIPEEVRDPEDQESEYPEDVIPPRPMYKELTRKQTRVLVSSLILFLGMFPITITVGIDLMNNGLISWSYYVIIPVLAAALIAIIFYRFGRKPLFSVSAMLGILLVVQLLIERRLDPDSGVFGTLMPFFLITIMAVELLLIYLTVKRRTVLQILDAVFLDAAWYLCALDLIISSRLGWSLIVLSTLLPVSLYLYYVQHTRKRGLNMAGFFFFDLAFMLASLDLSTSMRFSWSIVTSLIFLVIGLLFYVLHIVLFNDTDWKKAMHL